MVYFKNKIPIWANFAGLKIEKVGIVCAHLVYLMVIWRFCGDLVYISPSFGTL
jgi:hypothetical protein